MKTVDTLIHARWIVPVEPAGVLYEHHSLAVNQGRIVDLLPAEQARAAYRAGIDHELDSHLLMPGLVNAHTHAAMSLLRGLAAERVDPELLAISYDFVGDLAETIALIWPVADAPEDPPLSELVHELESTGKAALPGVIAARITCGLCEENANHSRHAVSTWQKQKSFLRPEAV